MILTMKIWILTTKHFQLNSIVTVVVQTQVVKQSEQMNSCTAGHAYTAVLILFVLPSHDTDLQNTNTRHHRSVHPTGGKFPMLSTFKIQNTRHPRSIHPRGVKFPMSPTFIIQTPDIPEAYIPGRSNFP